MDSTQNPFENWIFITRNETTTIKIDMDTLMMDADDPQENYLDENINQLGGTGHSELFFVFLLIFGMLYRLNRRRRLHFSRRGHHVPRKSPRTEVIKFKLWNKILVGLQRWNVSWINGVPTKENETSKLLDGMKSKQLMETRCDNHV